MSAVFDPFETVEKLTILDVGPGKASTVAFLGDIPSRVFFSDLFSESVTLEDEEADNDEREAYAQERFEHALGISADTQIDVCLFWDYFHCLSVPELRGFSRALRPHLHRRTRGYAFGALHADVHLDHSSYGIHDMEQLWRQPAQPLPVHHPHTQKTLTESFAAFTISRGTLLREGRLELLLEAT